MTTAERLFNEAKALDKEGNIEKAVTLYMGAAELGYVPAQLNAGVAYLFGKGVAQDYKTAVYWLQQAAAQNNASAISNLAYCYMNGYGVAKDESKALELYKKAANLGETTASKQYDILSQRLGNSQKFGGFDVKPASANKQTTSFGNTGDAHLDDFLKQAFKGGTQNIPTVDVEVQLVGPKTASTTVSVYVPEFKQAVNVVVPNHVTEGKFLMVTAETNARINGIHSALRLNFKKITFVDTVKASPAGQTFVQNTQRPTAQANIDIDQKVKALKRRVYTVPIFNLIITIYWIISLATMLVMPAFPDVRLPAILGNILGIGFSVGFIFVFYFWFLPWIIGRYPKAGFFKTRKIMKHLEKRNLLEKAVLEMETCTLSDFGDRMCLSDNFLFPKKKNGIIIPCDELLWVYADYSKRRRYGHLMLGTKYWGIVGLSGAMQSKKYNQMINDAGNALLKRNPGILMTNTPENRKKYNQLKK